MRPFEAALKGAREIGFTIISITFSLIAVFIPVLLMGGMVGRVFREFAVTIAVAIIVSGFVSLTLTPMLCARVLRTHHEGEKQNVVLRAFEAMFNSWLRGYEWTLDKVLRYKFVTLMVTLGTMAGTVYLYIVIPKGFFPVEDTGFISATVEGPADISFRAMLRAPAAQIAEIIRRIRRSTTSIRRSASAARTRPTIPAACSSRSSRRRSADSSSDVIAAAAPHDQHRHRHGGLLPRRSRTSISAAASPRANSSTRCSRARPRRSIASSDEMLEKIKTIDGPARRQQRPLHQEPADRDRDRPREGGVLRHLGRSDPPGAVQRLRQPPGRDDLHADQRLPDHPGDAARIPGRPVRPVEDLSQDQPRQHAPRPVDAPAAACIGIGTPNGLSIPLSAVTRLDADGRPAAGQPPGPAALGDDLVQPRARHLARRRRSTRSSRSSASPTCRSRSPPASRATRRCSRSR